MLHLGSNGRLFDTQKIFMLKSHKLFLKLGMVFIKAVPEKFKSLRMYRYDGG
jgi:hypothetical protein